MNGGRGGGWVLIVFSVGWSHVPKGGMFFLTKRIIFPESQKRHWTFVWPYLSLKPLQGEFPLHLVLQPRVSGVLLLQQRRPAVPRLAVRLHQNDPNQLFVLCEAIKKERNRVEQEPDWINMCTSLHRKTTKKISPSVHVASSPTVVPNNFPCQIGQILLTEISETTSITLSAIRRCFCWYLSLHDLIRVSGSI